MTEVFFPYIDDTDTTRLNRLDAVYAAMTERARGFVSREAVVEVLAAVDKDAVLQQACTEAMEASRDPLPASPAALPELAGWQERQQKRDGWSEWYDVGMRKAVGRLGPALSEVVGGIEYQWRPVYALSHEAITQMQARIEDMGLKHIGTVVSSHDSNLIIRVYTKDWCRHDWVDEENDHLPNPQSCTKCGLHRSGNLPAPESTAGAPK